MREIAGGADVSVKIEYNHVQKLADGSESTTSFKLEIQVGVASEAIALARDLIELLADQR